MPHSLQRRLTVVRKAHARKTELAARPVPHMQQDIKVETQTTKIQVASKSAKSISYSKEYWSNAWFGKVVW